MKIKKANKLINRILKNDFTEIGIFISMLSYKFIEKYNIDEKDFYKHLKSSIKILKGPNKNE